MLDKLKSAHSQVKQTFLLGALYASVISLGPPMLIYHRSLNTFFDEQSWQNTIFYATAIVFGGLAMSKVLPEKLVVADQSAVGTRLAWLQTIRKVEFPVFISGFFFLYVACCALCQKLEFTQLPGENFVSEAWKTFGLLIILLALVIQAQILQIKQIVHPIYFSCLLLLLGLPFLFSVWMPLFAVPGAFIIFKWRINMQAKIMNSSSMMAAEPTDKIAQADGKGRWQLLPYIY